jgi:hypothetical protein
VTAIDQIVDLGVAALVASFWVAVCVGIAVGVMSVLSHHTTGGPRHA